MCFCICNLVDGDNVFIFERRSFLVSPHKASVRWKVWLRVVLNTQAEVEVYAPTATYRLEGRMGVRARGCTAWRREKPVAWIGIEIRFRVHEFNFY